MMLFALEIIASLLALVYLVLVIRKNIWAWMAGAISAAIYVFLMIRSELWMQAGLWFFYTIFPIYGAIRWRHNKDSHQGTLHIRTWPLRYHAYMATALLGLTMGLGHVYGQWLNIQTATPLLLYIECLITVASLFTTWMVTQCVLENWLYWIMINTLSVYLYATQGLWVMTGLFVIYVLLATQGYQKWKEQL